jgi:hypothetical protein
MTDILNTSFFDPIAGHIRLVKPAQNYIEIEVPHGLTIDKDEVLKYYENDATLVYERSKSTMLKGTLKDPQLFRYLLAKYYENGPVLNS